MSDYLDPNNEELLKDFFLEAELQVETLEQNILTLENDPGNREAVDEIFRAAHTLKGAAATVQMNELSEFTHLCEDVLDEIRSNKVLVNEEVVDTLLNAIDIIKAILEARSEGHIFSDDISLITSSLQGYLDGSKGKPAEVPAPKAPAKEPAKSAPVTGVEAGAVSEYELLEMKEAAGPGKAILQVEVRFNEDNPMNTVGGIQIFALLKKSSTILKTNPEFEELYKDQYYPVVEYYIAADISEAEIQEMLHLPDTVTEVRVLPVTSAVPAPQEAPKPVEKAPEPQAAPAPRRRHPYPSLLRKRSPNRLRNRRRPWRKRRRSPKRSMR